MDADGRKYLLKKENALFLVSYIGVYLNCLDWGIFIHILSRIMVDLPFKHASIVCIYSLKL